MDEITDRKQAELIRRGLADEQMRAKLMRDLFSPDEQVQLRAMESLRDYLGDKITDDIGIEVQRNGVGVAGPDP
jgi:hypothetical protein